MSPVNVVERDDAPLAMVTPGDELPAVNRSSSDLVTPVPLDGAYTYFCHVGKTAGVTIRQVLTTYYPRSLVCRARQWPELLDHNPYELLGYRLFAGHFGASFIRWFPEDLVVLTMLREPLKRVISWYRYIRRSPGTSWYEIATREAPTLATFVDHPIGGATCRNYQTAVLANDDVDPAYVGHWRSLVPGPHRESMRSSAPPLDDDEALGRALARLESCAWVGVVERFDESIALLVDALGVHPPGDIPALNVRPRSDAFEVSPEERERLTELNRLDAMLHSRACELVDERFRRLVRNKRDEWCARELASRSTALAGSLTIGLDEGLASGGWLPREHTPEGIIRRIGPSEHAWVDLPVRIPPGTQVEVLVHATTCGLALPTLALEVNDHAVPARWHVDAEGARLVGTVPAAAVAAWTRIRLTDSAALAAGDRGPGSTRRVHQGTAVRWIRLREPISGTGSSPPHDARP